MPILHGIQDRLGFIPADQSSRLRYYHPPGDGNALGRLKVTLKGMPDIYLHDTPTRSRARRR